MAYSMPTGDWESLLEGLARGEYSLLLGAGASLGARGGDGNELPSAGDLSQQMLDAFAIDTSSERVDLKMAYELTADTTDSLGRSRPEYFRARFTQCSPTWH